MARGSNLKEKILELRRKKKSYNQIAEILGIRKGKISYWVAHEPESQKTKEILTEKNNRASERRIRIIIKAQQERWRKWHAAAAEEAARQFPKLVRHPLFVAGLMLYWGEGDSNPKNALRLTNSSPELIAVYVSFLKKILAIPKSKIRLGLILYPYLSDAVCKRFWSDTTGLSEDNFVKTQFIKGFHPTKRLSHGICMVAVNSRQMKTKVRTWIEIFAKRFIMT